MLKNILKLEGVNKLAKAEQFLILGGTVRKLVCVDGESQGNGGLPSCHCVGLQDGIYMVRFNDDNDNYETYNVLGSRVDNSIG